MKKYGKYEKRTEGVSQKQPKVKNMLLQTYFTSLLCLVLCVTMFFGTSYAWFTSEVNNEGNEIYVGVLKVGLYKVAGEQKTDLDSSEHNKLFDKDIRWEPGYTALETIRVKNEGDLAFKYVLNFTGGTLGQNDNMELAEVAKHFDVWVYDHSKEAYVKPESYGGITAEDSGWKAVGTLADVLDGKTVLDGELATEGKEATYTIALHMKEAVADASVMGQKITLNVKLVAYQMSSEQDGFGSGNYDSAVEVASDAASLGNALGKDGTTQLITDVTIGSAEDRVTMNGGTLYGNGKKITYNGEKDKDGNSLGVLTTSGGTIKNLTIEGGKGRALYVTELQSDLYVSDCTLSGLYAFNLNSAKQTDKTLTFENTVFKSWTSYANVMEEAVFTGCTFEDNLKPYGDTVLKNCTFTNPGNKTYVGLDVTDLVSGETITLENCDYLGTKIGKATVSNENGNIQISVESGPMLYIRTTYKGDGETVDDIRVVLTEPTA